MRITEGMNPAPFIGTVEPVVCDCKAPVKELFTARTAEKAIANITGYWSVYLTFFGEQMVWLQFLIVDTRDGTVIWRNGRALQEEKSSGKGSGNESAAAAGDGAGIGRWLIGGGDPLQRGTGQARRDGW